MLPKGECEASPGIRLSPSLRWLTLLTMMRRRWNVVGLTVGAGCQLKRLQSHIRAFGIILLFIYLLICLSSRTCILYYSYVQVKGQELVLSCHQMDSGAQLWILRPGGEAPLPTEPPHCPRTTLITSAEVRRLAGCGQHPFGIRDYKNGGRHWRAASIQQSLLPDNDAVWLEASSSCSSASQPHGLCPGSARVGYFSLTLPWTEHLLN